jgi:hypothetical protein
MKRRILILVGYILLTGAAAILAVYCLVQAIRSLP